MTSSTRSSTSSEGEGRRFAPVNLNWASEKLQLRLLMLEEKYRSQVMYKQIEAFEEKVFLSFDDFSISNLLNMIQTLSQRTKPPKQIRSFSQIRNILQLERRRASTGNDPSRDGNDKCKQYFGWFFQYLDYIRELKDNFSERIFLPLFKYFYEGRSYNNDDSRRSSSTSASSKFSLLSFGSEDSGQTLGNNDDYDDIDDVVYAARQRAHSRTSLMLLSKEFADIKTLYDTSEIDKVAHRLSFVKEQLDFFLEDEGSIDSDLYSQESGNLVYHFDVDERTENLIRFIPDILIKFRKAAWLARRWLELDDMRTKDLNQKMQKVLALERRMSNRMTVLEEDIKTHEEQLESDINDLQTLLKREDRSNELSMTLCDLEERIGMLERQLEGRRQVRNNLTQQLMAAIQAKNKVQYIELKVVYETNRLQRYMIQRQLATLRYHRNLAEDDMRIELDVKPSLIHNTNHLQDKCEKLEQLISLKRNEKYTIKTALIPIIEDRKQLTARLNAKRMSEPVNRYSVAQYLGSTQPTTGKRAMFVRTFRDKPAIAEHVRSFKIPTTPEW